MSELLETTATDDYAFQAEALAEGWSDGLPVLAPTPERVAAMLATVDAPRELSLGPVPPAGRLATLESVAANAVLAGMQPEWFPVLVAALAAALDPVFNLEGGGGWKMLNTPMEHEHHAAGDAAGSH